MRSTLLASLLTLLLLVPASSGLLGDTAPTPPPTAPTPAPPPVVDPDLDMTICGSCIPDPCSPTGSVDFCSTGPPLVLPCMTMSMLNPVEDCMGDLRDRLEYLDGPTCFTTTLGYGMCPVDEVQDCMTMYYPNDCGTTFGCSYEETMASCLHDLLEMVAPCFASTTYLLGGPFCPLEPVQDCLESSSLPGACDDIVCDPTYCDVYCATYDCLPSVCDWFSPSICGPTYICVDGATPGGCAIGEACVADAFIGVCVLAGEGPSPGTCAGVAVFFGGMVYGGGGAIDCTYATAAGPTACNVVVTGWPYATNQLGLCADLEEGCVYIVESIGAVDFTALCAPQADADADHIPDVVEQQVCSRAATAELVGGDEVPGSCSSYTDYTPPPTSESVRLPYRVTRGADSDGDGVPSTATVHYRTYTVNAFAEPVLTTGGSSSSTVVLDANDSDPNTPVPYDDVEAAVAYVREAGEEAIETVVATVLGAIEAAQDEVEETVDAVDGDHDEVPDQAEPTLCYVEDRSTPVDGTCTAGDYDPPVGA